MTLTNLNGRGHMRIPLTVGDIYGRSGLQDSDDFTYGGPVQTAELTVECRDGQVILLGGRLDNGRAQVALNAPIDLEVNGWTTGDLHGRAADGREVVLRVSRRLRRCRPGRGSADRPLRVNGRSLLGGQSNLTKHQAVLAIWTMRHGSSSRT
jgi:hypothetical protein